MTELLIDKLEALGVDLQNFKVHLASPGKDLFTTPPLHAFFEGVDEFRKWQEVQTQKNFECSTIVALIHLGNDRWLFAGVYRVIGDAKKFLEFGIRERWKYPTELVPNLDEYIGRLIIRYHRYGVRASYRLGENIRDQLEVVQTLDDAMQCPPFPGLVNLRLSHKLLATIIKSGNPDWKNPLSQSKGVYVILDNQTGKLYVGSACGRKSIWQRWAMYIEDGHGGNKKLKELISSDPNYAVRNFQYAILEVVNGKRAEVVAREEHWKSVLGTRLHGYNLAGKKGVYRTKKAQTPHPTHDK